MSNFTAGLIIIADEILKGQITDTNSQYLSKRLYEYGVSLKKIAVIGDNIDEIAEEVVQFSSKFNLVFTSGGIGATHDDVTYQGVAKAFGESVYLNKEMALIINKLYPGSSTSIEANPALRMAEIPQSSQLVYIDPNKISKAQLYITETYPIVRVSNVYIFPGLPQYFEFSFDNLKELFQNPNPCIFHNYPIYLNIDEVFIIPVLNSAVNQFKTQVVFGCYPHIGNDTFNTKLTLESTSKEQLKLAIEYLTKNLPVGSILQLKMEYRKQISDELYNLIKENNSHYSWVKSLKDSIKILGDICKKYQPHELFISFNGGKDCTLLLHLVVAVMYKEYDDWTTPLQAMYIQGQDPFPEVETFINDTVERYNLSLTTIKGNIKDGLGHLLTNQPELKAVFIGTKRTDPHSKDLEFLQMTDEGWPQVLRISPLLDWSYQDIWHYLLHFKVPYCSLYEKGYTSLGGRHNTNPNPALKLQAASDSEEEFAPAYHLKDDDKERLGRF